MTATAAIANPYQTSRGGARDGCGLVLVIDDDASYRRALAAGLTGEGFAVELAEDGFRGLQLFHQIRPDLVLLDVTLPDRSGIELCQQLRALRPVPIIMVTERRSEIDVVLSLEMGASDYVAKPFRFRELVARMRAVLRRGMESGRSLDEVLQVGPVRLDAARREVTVRHVAVELSRKEFDLLALLMTYAGQVVTRDVCINQLWWDQELINSRTLDSHVKRLRRKIESDSRRPDHIITVRGVGFRFEG